MNINNKNVQDAKFLTNKNPFDNKIFKGRIITYKPPNIYFKETEFYNIFFTKSENEKYCNLNSTKSSSYITSEF